MKALKLLPAVMVGVIVSLPFSAFADTSAQPIEKLISELADKPEQHAAVASYYQEKAAEAKKELEHHKAMKNSYPTSPKNPSAYTAMQAHCDNLIKAYETEVKEYEQLAKEHDAAGKKSLKN